MAGANLPSLLQRPAAFEALKPGNLQLPRPTLADTPSPTSTCSTCRRAACNSGQHCGEDSSAGTHDWAFDSRVFVPERTDCDISHRYKICEGDIGAGSFGQVFVAEDSLCPGRLVAIKKLPTPDESLKAAFKKEALIMKTLDHPAICKIMETYEKGHVMYIVMEYCEGGQVFDRITEDGLIEESITIDIIRQVVGALKYAHSKAVAHRDLKPENLCFCSKDPGNHRVMIIDWGVAFHFGLTRMRSTVGTVTYAAPEVRMDMGTAGYSSACDLWSLGVMIYVMLSGRPPFWGKNQFRKMMAEEYPMSSPEWQAVSEDAKSLIRGLLKADPSQRLSIFEVAEHPWLREQTVRSDPAIALQVMSNMRQFSQASHLFSLGAASVARQLDHNGLRDVHRVFCDMDTNGDGVLEFSEMRVAFERVFGEESDALRDLEWVFRKLDMDGSGSIDYTEFCAAGIWKRMSIEEDVLRAAFKTFDHVNDGRISKQEMQEILSNADVKRMWTREVCDEAVEEVMQEYDANGDGSIDFDEWVYLMRENAERCHKGWATSNVSGSTKHDHDRIVHRRLTPMLRMGCISDMQKQESDGAD